MAKSLLQSKEWATLRQSQGWQAYDIDGTSVLGRKLFVGKSFLYAPEVAWEDISTKLQKLYENTKKIAQKTNTIFFRLEILNEFDEKIINILTNHHFIKAFEEIQPEYRQIVDISPAEEDILSQMREKGRYNIRLAQKHGVVVRKSENINEFYKIYCETAARDGFEIRPQKYFEKLIEILQKNDHAELLVALYNNNIIAAEITSFYDDTASYLYGASSNQDRQVMAPYLLHWEAIRRAKAKGCKYYDLLAVDPQETEIKNKNPIIHKYAGIGRFKRQFGGKTVQLVGGWDMVYQPMWYKAFKIAEKLRRK